MIMKIKKQIVQSLRKEKGWSQQHLADLCGVNLRTIQRVENTNSCSLETHNALLSVFELERDYLENNEHIDCLKMETGLANIKLDQINWRKYVGISFLLLNLIFYSALYMVIVQDAADKGMEIRWFESFYLLIGDEVQKSHYMIIPMFYYFNIIVLTLLVYGCVKNSILAAWITVFWLPMMHIDSALVSGSLTPVTIFVALVIGYVMVILLKEINNLNAVKNQCKY